MKTAFINKIAQRGLPRPREIAPVEGCSVEKIPWIAMFDPVDPKASFPALERGMLKYWKEEDIFKRSLHQRATTPLDMFMDAKHRGESFTFYDGPPFATGLPHYGHLLAGTIKDVIPRYQTMCGRHVQRRFGWDCHGLPIENMIEKEQGLKSRRDIEAMGVKQFNALCRASVQRYTKEWRSVVERMGRFVDMDWDYRTMDADFMESIWWAFKSLHDKELIYEGYKPMHICPRCATPLSNFEVTQGYKDRTDQSVIATFPLVDEPDTVLLAWTTTPWSLPGNMWLAVGPDISYVKVKSESVTYVLAEKLVEKVFGKKEHTIVGPVKAKDLVGKRYVPLFPYFMNTVIASMEKSGKPQTYGQRVYKVVINDAVAVSDAEGTGIVHLTSSTGEDSNAVATTEKVDVLPHVQMDGYFIPAVTDFQGIHVKPEGKDPMATDTLIINWLKQHGRGFSSYTIDHSYPHCWRCDTPLLPYTTGSWFVAVEKIKARILAANKKTTWVPDHLRDGRFGKWLEAAHDWAISRNRYWGTPLPIWRNHETKELEVIGSRDDLMAHVPWRLTKITVLRHGESEGNTVPLYECKEPGSGLTTKGKQQVEAAAQWLAACHPSQAQGDIACIIYTSPLARAQETAAIIAKKTGATVIIDDRLREIDFGPYEGKKVDFSDLAIVRERRAKKIESGSVETIYHFQGMETWPDVQKRVAAFLEEILPRHRGEHVIIVTHADPVANIQHYFTREDPVKISHQPTPRPAAPKSYMWDHMTNAAFDLHKETVDEIVWSTSAKKSEGSVELTLVRHCVTDLNVNNLTQGGDTDQPLNDQGRAQAEDLVKKLKGKTFDAIVCSDRKRAIETAEIIGKGLGIGLAGKWPELTERACGDWNRKDFHKIMLTVHRVSDDETPVFYHRTAPGGESLNDFLARLQRAREKLLKDYAGKSVLVVGHKGTIQALNTLEKGLTHKQGIVATVGNGGIAELTLHPLLRRIPEVLDCWFESGSMPYAQGHYPFSYGLRVTGDEKKGNPKLGTRNSELPEGFPANFIAENLDQTRGWFYTLMVLSTALFNQPAFSNCICGGIILAEDGKKMSKRLKNYPDPTGLMDQYGADALRFALMSSPVVRAEELRFSDRSVREVVQNVILPLWNTYSFFVTYANAAKWQPTDSRKKSTHPLDEWLRAEVQDLTNRMTAELDAYDLSATCGQLNDTIDALTNWYVRLSRRRFAGKDCSPEEQTAALSTLYQALLTISQLLAPFCPYMTDAIYLNLVAEDHGSIHLTDWPEVKTLTAAEKKLIEKNRFMRKIVFFGNSIRSSNNIKLRQPLSVAQFAVRLGAFDRFEITEKDKDILKQELNVMHLEYASDPGKLATTIARVKANVVGPKFGQKVQKLIAEGKLGKYKPGKSLGDGTGEIEIDGEILIYPTEVTLEYVGKEGHNVAGEKGIVVSIDTKITPELQELGMVRDLVRAVQQLRKDAGLQMQDRIVLQIDGAPEFLSKYDAIQKETNSTLGKAKGEAHSIDLGDTNVTIRFMKI